MHALSSISVSIRPLSSFFFFNCPAATDISTLSLHDALPISVFALERRVRQVERGACRERVVGKLLPEATPRSEEHTSELQSLRHLVCRLLLEKKNTRIPPLPRWPTPRPRSPA